MANAYDYINDGLEVWCPDWPRRVTQQQRWADTKTDAIFALRDAEREQGSEPYISAYSFPRGHTKGGNIPRINTLFIDLDFEGGDYDGDGDRDAWRRDISHLLVRARMVAREIQESGANGWRASLSGHKGVHLFLDFPALDSTMADFPQFIDGLDSYANQLVDELAERTGISDLENYVDVTSSDLGRLCRAPNTRHNAASQAFDEDRYCVPIGIDELANLTVDDYQELTSSRREVPYDSRNPNHRVGQIISQHVRHATTPDVRDNRTSSISDYGRVEDYKEQTNGDIELSDIEFLTADRPCVWAFYERDDKYQYGSQSHYMELFCIRELIEHDVPIDVIHDFLDSAPEYSESYSQSQIETVIARDYNRFTVAALLQNAPEFANSEDCGLCEKVQRELNSTHD